MTPAIASYTGTVKEARVTSSAFITYKSFDPQGHVVFLTPHLVDDDQDYLEAVRAGLSRLWAQDWDSSEDSVYDTW